jgi:hypothetical protein
MILLRSGTVLFVMVTVGAAAIFTVLFFALLWPTGWHAWSTYSFWHAQGVAVVTGPTYALLTFAAWRGRRHPALDGTVLIAAIALVSCAIWYAKIWFGPFPDELTAAQSRSWAGMAWTYCFLGLMSIIPAHLITYFALHRTPLLRGLVPQKVELKAWLDQRP